MTCHHYLDHQPKLLRQCKKRVTDNPIQQKRRMTGKGNVEAIYLIEVGRSVEYNHAFCPA